MTKYRCSGGSARMPGRGAGKVLADQSKTGSETGKKTLRCGLQRVVDLKPEPAAERLRNDIGQTVAGHNRGYRLAERNRNIPCKSHRPVCRTSDTRDGERMQGRAVGAVGITEKLGHLAKWRSDVGRRIGINDNDGAARVSQCGQIEGIKGMRGRSCREAGVDQRVLREKR